MNHVSMRSVSIPVESAGQVTASGVLTLPQMPSAIVLFAQGCRAAAPCHMLIARHLHDGGMGTLLLDLPLSNDEGGQAAQPDLGHCAQYVVSVTHWLRTQPEIAELPIGFFGCCQEGAPVLCASALLRGRVPATVCCGGRPDLAKTSLQEIHGATLLIVGGQDEEVVDANRQAYERLNPPKHMAIVSGATHPAEERDSLDEVALLATEWFGRYLRPAA